MVEYNEAKIQILNLAKNLGEVTSLDVAELTGRRYENSSMLMLQYFRFGLLGRNRLKGSKAFSYFITDLGVERLNWLNQEAEDPDMIDEEEEPEEEEEVEYEIY